MDKDEFLSRIAARHGRPRLAVAPARSDISRPAVTIVGNELTNRFKTEMESVGGVLTLASSLDDAAKQLRTILNETAAQRVVTWDKSLFESWLINWLWDSELATDVNVDDFNTQCLGADVGITLAHFAVAETGSLVLLTSPATPRSVSLTPTTHIALLRQSQIVATAEDVFAQIESGNTPSSIHFITGPSRSADIENDLSIGVHGPAAVYGIVLCD